MKKSLFVLGFFLSICYAQAQDITRGELMKLYYKAQKAQKSGETKDVISAYKEIIRIQPQLADPYLHLGNLYKQDSLNISSMQMSSVLLNKYLTLKPNDPNSTSIKKTIAEIDTKIADKVEGNTPVLANIDDTDSKTETPVIASAITAPSTSQPATPAPQKTEAENKTSNNTTTVATPVTAANSPNETISVADYDFKGRWVSNFRGEGNRETWIIDLKKVHNEMRAELSSNSAITKSEALRMYSPQKDNKQAKSFIDVFKSKTVVADTDKDELAFKYVIDHKYTPSKSTFSGLKGIFSVVGSIASATGLDGIADVTQSASSVNDIIAETTESNDIAKNIYIEYDFRLRPTIEGMKGTLRISHVEKTSNGERVISDDAVDCMFYKAKPTYTGFTFTPSTDKDRRENATYKEIFKNTQKSEKEKDIQATNNLGFLYLNGLGTDKNTGKAIVQFEKAALMGSTNAMINLALIHQSRDVAKAITWYEKAITAGDASAKSRLADVLVIDEDHLDFDKAINYYTEAAQGGDLEASYRLGWLNFEGIGINQDYAKAAAHFDHAIKKGNTSAMVEVAMAREKGIGSYQKDHEEALKLYRKAAANGNTVAMQRLSEIYSGGIGVEQDYTTSMEWYMKKLKAEDERHSGVSTLDLSGL